jgi:membrane associated rhomboid family serine protease
MSTFQTKNIFQHISRSDVLKIIVITSLAYVLLHFIRVTLLISGDDVAPFMTHVWNNLTLPPTWSQLMYKPWTLISYMFTDMSFMRILGNMIWLWIFALVIEDLKGKYQILPIYLMGGLVGGVAMVSYNTIAKVPMTDYFAGGVSALMAVVVAAVLYKPQYKFWFFGTLSIPIWLLGLIFLGLTTVSINTYTLPILFLYLGGILVGVLYNYGLTDFFAWCTIKFTQLGAYFTNNDNFVLERKNKLRVTQSNSAYRTIRADQSRIDAILDKINEKGLDSLSENEKRMLEEYSKK